MKPILVTNQADWHRLAPVLDKFDIRYLGGTDATKFIPAIFPFVLKMARNGEVFAQVNHFDISETQSVDEYIVSVQDNQLSTNKLGKVDDTNVADLDYKAKYEALYKAVSEAEKVMMEYANTFSGQNMPEMAELLRNAMIRAIQILTEKTQGL